MKIAQVISRSGCSSGGSIQALLLSKALAEEGHGVLFISKGGDCGKRAGLMGIDHAANPMRYRPEDVIRFVKLLRGFDVVHAHKGRALSFALLAKWILKSLKVFANRGVSFPLSWSNRWKYRFANGVVCVSFGIMRDLAKSGLIPERLKVVYGSIDDRFFGATPVSISELGPGSLAVALVGNFRPWKGHLILAEAASRLVDRVSNLALVFAGKEKESLLSKVKEVFKGRVVSLGYREDVHRVMAASDILVNASTEGEGVPGVVREAMAVGICVVASDLDGNWEMVRHGKNGFLFRKGDVEALCLILELLLRNPKLRKRAAVNGKRFAFRFTLKNRALAMVRVYGGC